MNEIRIESWTLRHLTHALPYNSSVIDVSKEADALMIRWTRVRGVLVWRVQRVRRDAFRSGVLGVRRVAVSPPLGD